MFAIDGVKLPSNASKHRSGTRAEFLAQAQKMERAATTMLERHQANDAGAAEDVLDAKAAARIERLTGTEIIPTSLDKTNDVVSKDVLYSPEHNLSVRLFLPHKATAGTNNKKLPILIYIHGGAWIIESPFSPIYHNYVADVVKSANCLAVSIQYRRAPEHPVPASYEDSWSAIEWNFSHPQIPKQRETESNIINIWQKKIELS